MGFSSEEEGLEDGRTMAGCAGAAAAPAVACLLCRTVILAGRIQINLDVLQIKIRQIEAKVNVTDASHCGENASDVYKRQL